MALRRFIIGSFISLGLIAIPAKTQPASDIFSFAAYNSWRTQTPLRDFGIAYFERFLRREKVYGIIPTYQILRTASMAGQCNQSAFSLPPQKYWPNIAGTLQFAKNYIIPKIGEVEAASGYRNPVLNRCAGGAPGSAHAKYFALDLVPKSNITRKELIAAICKIHDEFGAQNRIGLGFYNKTRFHIDSRSFRRWGPNGRGKTSPCGPIIPPITNGARGMPNDLQQKLK